MTNAANSFSGKVVVVTGAAGFLGRHVVGALLAHGATVRGVGRTEPVVSLGPSVEFSTADLRDREAAAEVMAGADIVFHLAAIGWGLQENIRRQPELLTENLLLNTAVLDGAHRAGVGTYLYTSSSAVYPSTVEHLLEEVQWTGPPHPTEWGFGWAKRVGEIQAQAYREHYGMRIAVVRPANPYGPWDNFEPGLSHVIPALIRRSMEREQPFKVFGSGRAVRSFIYASDVAAGMLAATTHYSDGTPVNLASPDATSIDDLVGLVLEITGHQDARIVHDLSKPDGHPRKVPDVGRITNLVGADGFTSLREGLVKTVHWYADRLLVAK